MENETQNQIKRPKYNRVKTPTVIQMEALECGAACLTMVLGYYGHYVPLEQARVACGISRDGSNIFNIISAAEGYGLEGKAYKKEIEKLFDLPLPLIAHWNFNHFVVIEGFSKNYVYINDPATGPRKITYSDLNACFTGVVLSLKPGPDFKKTPKPSIFSNVFLRRVLQMKASILMLILVSLIIVILQLGLAGFSQVFMDYLLQGKSLDWQWVFISSMAFLCIIWTFSSMIKQQLLNRLYMKLSLLFSTQFFWHIVSLPISFFAQRYSGEIAYRMSLNDHVASAVVRVVTESVLNVFLALIFGFALFYYDYMIASITLVIVIINLIVIYSLYRTRQDAFACYQQAIGKSNAFSIGAVSSIETLKATSSESKFFSRWSGFYTKSLNTLQNITKIDIISGVLPSFLDSLNTMAILMIGIWRVMNGELSIGMLLAVNIIAKNFTSPIYALIGLTQSIQLAKVDADRLEDVLKNPTDESLKIDEEKTLAPKVSSPTAKLEGFLDVKDVSFGFNKNGNPIFENISLSLAPGRSVALIGHSGCGKSTIAKLIGGFFVPWTGEIRFDGTLRNDLARELITNSLAIVEQETALFSDTVSNNITLMEAYPIQDELIRAAQDACIHEDIMRRKGGYDLMLESNGANLSGGQRQRMQIARALYRNPTILILDEATSALDSETEAEVIKNIRRRGCACLMVAHRLSTIKNCDEILVLSHGTIIQRGNHTELLKEEGLYKKLVEADNERKRVAEGGS